MYCDEERTAKNTRKIGLDVCLGRDGVTSSGSLLEPLRRGAANAERPRRLLLPSSTAIPRGRPTSKCARGDGHGL